MVDWISCCDDIGRANVSYQCTFTKRTCLSEGMGGVDGLLGSDRSKGEFIGGYANASAIAVMSLFQKI